MSVGENVRIAMLSRTHRSIHRKVVKDEAWILFESNEVANMVCALQPQLPANREVVHLNIPQPNLGSVGTALGRRLQDAAGEVSVPTLL